jgi:YesN/AraC family two-component response regulator
LFVFSFTKVIPRHQYRGRNRSSSAKFTSNASLLPTANVAVRSNSFRVHRNPIQHQQQQQPQQRSVIQSSFNNSNNINNNNNLLNTTGSVDSINFCKHTLYCCLHQQQPTQNQQQQQSLMQSKSSSSSSHIIVNPTSELDFNSTSIIQQMKFNELVNITSENYPNFSDDEKNSFRIHRKLSADSANFTKTNSNHIHNKSSSQQLMSSYGVFRCNIEDDDNNCGKFERV